MLVCYKVVVKPVISTGIDAGFGCKTVLMDITMCSTIKLILSLTAHFEDLLYNVVTENSECQQWRKLLL